MNKDILELEEIDRMINDCTTLGTQKAIDIELVKRRNELFEKLQNKVSYM